MVKYPDIYAAAVLVIANLHYSDLVTFIGLNISALCLFLTARAMK